ASSTFLGALKFKIHSRENKYVDRRFSSIDFGLPGGVSSSRHDKDTPLGLIFAANLHHGQSFGTFRIDEIDIAGRPAKHSDEEEAERRGSSDNRPHRQVALIQQRQLTLLEMLRTETVRTFAELASKIFNRKQIK